MKKNRWGDDDDDDEEDDLIHPLIKEGYLIQILVWLPVVSLLRFKSVCKSWFALITSSFFIDLHTATTFNSSSKFGSFILHASVNKRISKHSCIDESGYATSNLHGCKACTERKEHELLMLSESHESRSESVRSSGCRWLWSTGYNDVTCRDTVQLDDFDDQVFKEVDDDLVLKFDNLGFPPCYKIGNFTSSISIVDSCNGLVCLYTNDTTNQVSLWNPVTRQFRHLPKNTISSEDSFGPLICLVSFGFDAETKDYKVMLLTRFRPRSCHDKPALAPPMECFCRVEVYSLSTDSWSLLEGITSLPGDPLASLSHELLYLNGSCFILAFFFHTKEQPSCPENNRFIISFDFTTEFITTIPLPYHHQDQNLYLTCFGEKIALYISEYYENFVDDDDDDDVDVDVDVDVDDDNVVDDDDDDDTGICSYEDFNIWVLNEQGSISSSSSSLNKEPWTKLHSFRIEHRIPGEWTFPRGISNDGKFALLETKCSGKLGKKMKLYNLVTKEVKKDFLFCNMVMSKAIVYKPSLVSI